MFELNQVIQWIDVSLWLIQADWKSQTSPPVFSGDSMDSISGWHDKKRHSVSLFSTCFFSEDKVEFDRIRQFFYYHEAWWVRSFVDEARGQCKWNPNSRWNEMNYSCHADIISICMPRLKTEWIRYTMMSIDMISSTVFQYWSWTIVILRCLLAGSHQSLGGSTSVTNLISSFKWRFRCLQKWLKSDFIFDFIRSRLELSRCLMLGVVFLFKVSYLEDYPRTWIRG